MLFEDIIGQENIKKHLIKTVANGRIPHAQLFVAPQGSGALPVAVAFAQYILCKNYNEDQTEEKTRCNHNTEKLIHPDLHFVFPVATNSKIKSHPVSNLFLEEWRTFIKETPYGSLYNWYQHIGIEKKQGQIGVDEAEDIVKKLSLKSYKGGFKVMIIWMAEKLNVAAANKLLKIIEEPPENTILILIAEDEEQIIKTILSRCQILNFKSLSEGDIKKALVKKEGIDENLAAKIAHRANGNYNKAIHLLHNDANDLAFENWFIFWVRTAFKAKGNAAVIQDLVSWSDEISKSGRETQKRFLQYCLQFFRQAMLLNYKVDELVYYEPQTQNFDIRKFAPFVHSTNVVQIIKALNDAIYHIERNGNAKIILLDLSINLTRFLHQKESVK